MRVLILVLVAAMTVGGAGCGGRPLQVEVVHERAASPPNNDDDAPTVVADDGADDDIPDGPNPTDPTDPAGPSDPVDPVDPPAPLTTASFVGGACAADDGCFEGGFCLDDGEGFPHGTCSMSCTRLCPDDDNAPLTFCVDDPAGDDGVCVSRCDVNRLGHDGCRDGYRCVTVGRHREGSVTRDVCWPDTLSLPTPPTTTTPTTPPTTTTPPGTDGDDTVCTEADLPTPNAGIVEPAGVAGCPAGMSPVAGRGVCMDRWEAFVEEVLPDGRVIPFSPFRHPGSAIVVARSAPGAVPQGYISGLEARSACGRAGKRLCTETEWTGACQGPSGFTYPYGNTRRDGVCNDARAVHPAVEYFGTGASWIWSRLGHPCINQLPDSVALTGSHPGCATADGHFDLMGNVHEWISDPAGTFRGGFYVDTVRNGPGCLYRTSAHDMGHWDYSTGFRCCADP